MHDTTVQVGGVNVLGAIYLGLVLLVVFLPLLLLRRLRSLALVRLAARDREDAARLCRTYTWSGPAATPGI